METTRQTPAANVEVFRPCGEAWDRMWSALRSCDLNEWLTFGFVTWVGLLGSVNFRGNPRFTNPFSRQPVSPMDSIREAIGQAEAYADAHAHLVVLLAVVGAIVWMGLAALLWYLGSRGTFMYLDCVYRGQAAVLEPWRQTRSAAHSYFRWRLLFGAVSMAVSLTAMISAAVLTWPTLRQLEFDPPAIILYAMIGGCAALILLPVWLAQWVLWALVAPVMYLRGLSGREAWSEVLGLIAQRPGSVFLYWLLNLGLEILTIMASVVIGFCSCCFCCLGVWPVIRETLLQPLFFWIRAYSFHFLAQFGPQYPPRVTPPAGEDLPQVVAQPAAAGSAVRIVSCPACGQPYRAPTGTPGAWLCSRCGARIEVR